MRDRPNILLIVFDTARADAFEPYGAALGSSPAFADLAAAGFALQTAQSNACWTVPAHAALFTGLLPGASGLIRAPGGEPSGCRAVLEAQADRLLPSVFRAAGYRTGAVSTNLWITPLSGFETGFETFDWIDTRRQATMSQSSMRARLGWAIEGARARVDDGAAAAGDSLRRFLDGAADDERPFLAFVNLVEAHSPYLPPKPYNPLGPRDRVRAALEARRHLTMNAIWRACAGGFDVPAEAIGRMRELYGAAIRLLDDWLARVLADLEARGLLEDTIVIVTSDHGENFGEGGLMGHAYSLDQRLTRIPFAARGPISAPEGAFSLASVPAVLAEAAGLAEHPFRRAPGEPDAAIAQFDPPAAAGDPRVESALRSWGLPADAAELITTPLRSATDGRWKLLKLGKREQLFDLEADPLESDPIEPATGRAEAPLGRLREALSKAEGEPAGAERPALGDSGPGPETEISDEERAALEDRMRLLGYM